MTTFASRPRQRPPLEVQPGRYRPRALEVGEHSGKSTIPQAPSNESGRIRNSASTFLFGPFRLLPTQRLLLDADKPLRLGSRALDILIALVERPGELVSKEELMSRIWPNTFVEPANLTVHVAALRRAIGDGREGNRYLVTIPGRGYRFVAPVSIEQNTLTPPPQPIGTKSEHNLPAQVTRLVGRTETIDALVAQLSQERCTTIAGSGGIGKTSVALAVAELLISNYEYGVWLVDLARVGAPLLLATELASLLGVEVHCGDPLACLIDHLRNKQARLEQMQSDFAHINRVSMMGELAAELSHELTQPIASARNNACAAQNFLDMQPPNLGEVRQALGCVVGDTDRAGDMIDRIRDYMKKAPPRKAQFDLNEAINKVIVLGRSAVIKNGVSVQTRLSEGLLPIHGDRVQLQQVVLNLVLNAVEAMGSVGAEPRELLISTEQDHRGVLVAVRDSGPGLDPSHLERVFDAFYSTKSSGMGMGLSICRSIIDAHGGRLWAEANKPRGAIFQFTLPAVQERP